MDKLDGWVYFLIEDDDEVTDFYDKKKFLSQTLIIRAEQQLAWILISRKMKVVICNYF